MLLDDLGRFLSRRRAFRVHRLVVVILGLLVRLRLQAGAGGYFPVFYPAWISLWFPVLPGSIPGRYY